MHRFQVNPLSPPARPLQMLGMCALLASVIFGVSGLCTAQVFTVRPDQTASKFHNLANLQPTSVPLEDVPLTMRTREELIRLFQAEQAFAVRPLPLGKHGLVLHANGPLDPSGQGYVKELEKDGISSKPGDRLIISKFDIKPDRVIFEFNGGPEKPHSILQHIQIGGMGGMAPLAQDNGRQPTGSRLTLVFPKFVPEMNAEQLRGLIAPILDFSLKTPIQAYADTLPPKLKHAILNHEILVGMNREMVIKAKGRPDQKIYERDGQTPFEEWIYGQPPDQVQFVRFNGDRVVRLEIANVGQKLIVRDKDETDGYWAGEFVHEVRLGDAPPVNPNQEHGPAQAPTLAAPGEKLPDAINQNGQLRPVQFPPGMSKPQPIPPTPGQSPSAQPPTDQYPAGQNPVPNQIPNQIPNQGQGQNQAPPN